MKEYRCGKCKKLLCVVRGNRTDFKVEYQNVNTNGLDEDLMPVCLEIKCDRCKKLNVFGVKEVLVGK